MIDLSETTGQPIWDSNPGLSDSRNDVFSLVPRGWRWHRAPFIRGPFEDLGLYPKEKSLSLKGLAYAGVDVWTALMWAGCFTLKGPEAPLCGR